MDSRKKTPEDRRYLLYRLGAHAAWYTSLGLTIALTLVRLSKPVMAPPTRFEQVSSIFIILGMGIAIALGSALARMRLARTITNVFQAGMTLGRFQDEQGKVEKR